VRTSTLTGESEKKTDQQKILETAFRIRAFETKLLELFRKDQLFGTVHTYIGQELCAAALHPHLKPGLDAVFATHRGHGHYLAYGGPADGLLAELMGREGAICRGRGGTQHLCYRRFFSSGLQGSTAPLATGYAWAMKRKKEKGLVVVQLGDGTMGEGTVYEAFTFASLLQAPVLFLLEYNGWAQSTDVTTTTPGDLLQRAEGFGLHAHRIKDDDLQALHAHLGNVVETVRGGKPFLQIIETRRLMAHSKGDDNRPKKLIEELWKNDPLSRRLESDPDCRTLAQKVEREVEALVEIVSSRPAVKNEVGAPIPLPKKGLSCSKIRADAEPGRKYDRVVEELNRELHALLAKNKDVLLVGEDLLDPYGGAFKVSRGLSTKFPDQIFSTPVAEAAIVGLANGLALAGMRPIAELMFADFATLATDQLINSAAKFHYMYGGRIECPVTVRLVSGGGRGYGPTHSQSLEHLFYGVPGLRVVALSRRHDPASLLRYVVLDSRGPTIFVENKLLYALRPDASVPPDLSIVPTERAGGDFPPLCYAPQRGVADVTIATAGGMTGIVETAMRELIVEEELRFDYVVITQPWPLDVDPIVDSVRRTKKLVVVEENVPDFGLGAAVIAAVARNIAGGFSCQAVGSLPVPIPSSRHLEDAVLPSVKSVRAAIEAVLKR